MTDAAKKMLIANVHIATANQDYPLTLPVGCKGFRAQARTAVDMRVAIVAGLAANSQPPYWTLKSGMVWNEDNLDSEGEQTLFFAQTAGDKWVEVIYWI